MDEYPYMVDEISEAQILSAYSNTKNLILIVAELSGKDNPEAREIAVRAASNHFPWLSCCLKEVRKGGRHYLVWQPRPGLGIPIVRSDLTPQVHAATLLDDILAHLLPDLEREWDPFNEPPAEYHVLRISEESHAAVLVLRHCAGGAATAAEIFAKIAWAYRAVITGETMNPTSRTLPLSTSRKTRTASKKSNWKAMLYRTALVLTSFKPKPSLPIGHGSPKDKGQYHIERILGVEMTQIVSALSDWKGARFIDLLVVAAADTLDKWNLSRNAGTGLVRTYVTVNMRGKYDDLEGPNPHSVLIFKSDEQDREDLMAFVGRTALDRIEQFDRRLDLRSRENLSRLINISRLLPFRLRRRIVHYVMKSHQFSVGINLMGTVFPAQNKPEKGQDEFPMTFGDLRFTNAYGVAYKMIPDTPVVFTGYSMLGRWRLMMAAYAWLFTREEAELFIDLFVNVLEDLAKSVTNRSQSGIHANLQFND